MSAERELPIDIKDTKLCDWLVDRRWTTLDNRDQSASIRKHINDAIQDMPDVDEITEMLAGSYITYYHCKRIVELLKVSEADSRTFFGSYSSKRMKDWLEIVKLYETDNIYLGESARILQHNVEYEIPSLKRKVSAAQSRINDSHRRETEMRAKAQSTQENFTATCKSIGIAGGEDIRKELLQLPSSLPNELEKVAALIQSGDFRGGMAYYTAFVEFTLDGKTQGDGTPFKLLTCIADRGNTSCYEYETGKPLPETSAPTATSDAKPDEASDFGVIDFGDDGGIDFGDGDGDGGIDFGDGIDFGVTDGSPDGSAKSGTDGWVEVSEPEGSDGIDFGDLDTIDLGEAGIQVADFGIEVADTPSAADTDGPTPAQRESLLANPTTRNSILDEIIQVESFLIQRLDELSNAIDSTSINQFEGAGPGVVQSKAAVETMLAAVAQARELLQSEKLQQLFRIRGSEKYVDRLASNLRQQKYHSATILGRIGKLEEQRAAAQALIEDSTPKIAALIKQTKVLQGNIEKSISGLYKGRPVNIIGDVNNL
eukprot:m.452960 g.452960  ORF g.452960 m.452960 type:complete len:541 (-) comp20419_c0_seq1:50-1672(-)